MVQFFLVQIYEIFTRNKQESFCLSGIFVNNFRTDIIYRGWSQILCSKLELKYFKRTYVMKETYNFSRIVTLSNLEK